MQKADIKENVDDMILQICKYIQAADLSEDEEKELKIESAASILTAAIDITDSPKENQEYIRNQFVYAITCIVILTKQAFNEITLNNYDKDRII